MSNLTLPQLFRYLLIGFVMIGLFYVCSPEDGKSMYAHLGEVGTPILALVVGAIAFCVYRSVLYGAVILRLVDRIHRENVRSLLREWYTIDSWRSAEALWKIVQEAELEDRLKNVDVGSASAHLLYMTAITTSGATIYLLSVGADVSTTVMLLLGSLVLWSSAFVSDYYIETIEAFLLKSIDRKKLDDFAGRMGFKKRTDPPEANKGGPANGSQPIRSETNRTSSAAGSRR